MQRQFFGDKRAQYDQGIRKARHGCTGGPPNASRCYCYASFFFLQFTRPYASQSYRPFLRVRGRGHTGDGRAPGFAPATIHSRRSQRRKTTRRRGSSTWKARSLTARASA